MDILLCDECLEKLMDNMSQNEILLLTYMNEKKMYNAQLSSDATKLASGIKGMTKYKLDIAIKRMELVGFITSFKSGSLKYYITKTGRKFIGNYRKMLLENTIAEENSSKHKE